MSVVRESSNIPSNSLPNVTDSSTQGTASSQTQNTDSTQSTGSTSFWDQERNFQANQDHKRRQMDKAIGDSTIAAASPLDADGGKQVTSAAGKAGMTVPSKQMLNKVSSAVQNHPQMKALEKYVSSGLHGQNADFLSPAGITKARSMAADIAKGSGLISGSTAAAFGASSAAATPAASSTAATPSATGASTGSTQGQTFELSKKEATSASTLGAASSSASSDGVSPIAGVAITSTPTDGTTTSGTTTSSTTATDATTDASSPAWLASGNISSVIMLACAGSMNEDNKIKAGRLNDMQKFNQISSLISDYISNTLQPAQAALDKKTEGEKSGKAAQARVSVDTWSQVDTDNLYQDGSGNFGLSKQVETERLTSTGLGTALQAAQGWAQTASNNSEQASNRFQAVDNQTNQTFTMLTGFLKAINDSNSALIRNYA